MDLRQFYLDFSNLENSRRNVEAGKMIEGSSFELSQCNSDIFFSVFFVQFRASLLTYFFPRSRKYLGAQLLNRVGVRRSRVSRWTNPLNFHAKCKYAIEREERSYVHISGDRLMEVAEEVLDYSGKNWFMNKFIYPKFRNKYGDRVIFETECGYNIND